MCKRSCSSHWYAFRQSKPLPPHRSQFWSKAWQSNRSSCRECSPTLRSQDPLPAPPLHSKQFMSNAIRVEIATIFESTTSITKIHHCHSGATVSYTSPDLSSCGNRKKSRTRANFMKRQFPVKPASPRNPQKAHQRIRHTQHHFDRLIASC